MNSSDNYICISKDMLVPGVPLGVDVYLYMTLNSSIVRYRLKGHCLTQEEYDAIKKATTTVPMVLKGDLRAVLELPGGVLQSALESNSDLKDPQVAAAAGSLLKSVDMSSTVSNDKPGAPPKTSSLDMLQKVQEVVEDVLIGMKESRAFTTYDKILAKIKASNLDPLANHHRQVSTLGALFLLAEGNASEQELAEIATAGLLHDVGLTKIAKTVAQKHLEGREDFTSAENFVYMKHIHLTLEILEKYNPPVTEEGVLQAIEFHHENFDGSGFTAKTGTQIPRLARFLRIADEVVVLMNDPGSNLNFKEALSKLRVDTEQRFDAHILNAICKQL